MAQPREAKSGPLTEEELAAASAPPEPAGTYFPPPRTLAAPPPPVASEVYGGPAPKPTTWYGDPNAVVSTFPASGAPMAGRPVDTTRLQSPSREVRDDEIVHLSNPTPSYNYDQNWLNSLYPDRSEVLQGMEVGLRMRRVPDPRTYGERLRGLFGSG
jgi:hypothetical protein